MMIVRVLTKACSLSTSLASSFVRVVGLIRVVVQADLHSVLEFYRDLLFSVILLSGRLKKLLLLFLFLAVFLP